MKKRLEKIFSDVVQKKRATSRKKSSSRSNLIAFGLPFAGTLLVAGTFLDVVNRSQRDSVSHFNATISENGRLSNDLSEPDCGVERNVSDAATEAASENALFVETTVAQAFENVENNADVKAKSVEKTNVQPEKERTQVVEKTGELLAEEDAAAEKVRRAQAAERDEKTRKSLNQIEFQFAKIKSEGVERADELNLLLAPLLEEAERLVETPTNDAALVEQTRSVTTQLKEFQRFIEDNRAFFEALSRFDEASVSVVATRDFLTNFLKEADASEALEIVERRRELALVASTLDALETVDAWNAFVEANGDALERFYVAPENAEIALRFLAQNKARQGVPNELNALERRVPEWKFVVENRVAIQRKILLALSAETEATFWTFAANDDAIYYLKQPPRPGRNSFVADTQGNRGTVEIPENAPETKTEKPFQVLALQELINDARNVPDSLRTTDPGRWFADWCAFVRRLQTEKSLDPLVRFQLLKKTTETLASGDFYFAKRLAPFLRVLDVPRLAPENVDRFDAENVETQELRRLARTRIAFLPNPDDYLTVDKTTERLDRGVEKIAFEYRRVGWLERDFSNAWRLRKPDALNLPVGDLYVLRGDVENDARDERKTSENEKSTRLSWLKIGASDGRQASIQLAASHVWRGSIVFCRTRDDAEKPVAERGESARFFRR